MALVLDTGPLLAALDRSDPDHAVCLELLRSARERRLIPGPVLVELDYWCAHKGIDDAFDSVLRDVQRQAFEIVELTSDDRERVLEVRADYRDLRVGFVDAAVLAVVERLGEPKLATLDRRHFTVIRPRHVDALELLPAAG